MPVSRSRTIWNWLLGELLAFLPSITGMFVWCLLVFSYAGYSLKDVLPLAFPCAFLAAVMFAEGIAYSIMPWTEPRYRVLSSLFTGFVVAATCAIFLLRHMHESLWFSGNMADVVLAGLVLGMPAGFICEIVRRDAKNFVDTKD